MHDILNKLDTSIATFLFAGISRRTVQNVLDRIQYLDTFPRRPLGRGKYGAGTVSFFTYQSSCKYY